MLNNHPNITRDVINVGLPTSSPLLSAELVILLHRPDGSLKTISEIEAEVIFAHIKEKRGDMSKTARSLGIGRSTLYRKMEMLHLNDSA